MVDRRSLLAGAGAAAAGIASVPGLGAPDRWWPDRDTSKAVNRLERAMSSGDADQVAACFAVDFRCETPLHPSRGFIGNEKVRQNWSAIFARVPDHKGRLLRRSWGSDGTWTEWAMTGTTTAGEPYRAGGPAFLTIKGGRIAAARFYLDQVTD
jgi:ketosteroid isomerase-like protein